MVFPDLSAPEAAPNTNRNLEYPIASVVDRCTAFMLDFMIFYPLISFLLSDLNSHIKKIYLVQPSTSEGFTALMLLAGAVFVLSTFAQTICLLLWNATPGQLFLQIRVRNFLESSERLHFFQALARSFFWNISALMAFIPFLEVYSHPYRRTMADRVSDTMVVTLKATPDRGPTSGERKLTHSWMRLAFLFFAFLASAFYTRTYTNLVSGVYKEQHQITSTCEDTQLENSTAVLDTFVTMFLLNEISSGCLESHANRVLWGQKVDDTDFAYIAKFLLSDSELQNKYVDQLCESKDSSGCLIVRYLNEDREAVDLSKLGSELSVVNFLLSEELYNQKKYDESLTYISKLQENEYLKMPLEKKFVRSVWALKELETLAPNEEKRQPASLGKWQEEFRERYELP